MANPEHLAILKQGVKAWNAWREKNPGIRPELSAAQLDAAELRSANLNSANLKGAGLHLAKLRDARLDNANLQGANLSDVELISAELSLANLTGADLSRADLRLTDLWSAVFNNANLAQSKLDLADLSDASLSHADLREAEIGMTTFAANDLSTTLGLETVKHRRPSSIGIDTIFLSKGKIPNSFLRGAGVPENFIQYLPSLLGTGIEFYSLFISYSTVDEDFAKRLYADLQAKGVRCWFAPHSMRSGEKIHEQIDQAIRVYDRLLLILSPSSITSNWVKTEIANARLREASERKRVLYPIRLCPFETLRDWKCFDADTGVDSAREIREYFIPDFSNWKEHDPYQKAFDALMKDLNKKADPS
jgi:uncharacterized protein YjbI with pentapeptide repeats